MGNYKSLKAVKFILIAVLLILLAGAIILYKERMLFLDGAFILFNIINTGSLQIQEHRYGSFITQIIPWLGLKLHLPLNVLMFLYSCSFNLFFLAIGVLLLYKYRRYDFAILLAFYLTLFVSDTFFWTNNEVHQGIAWMFLAFAATMNAAKNGKPLWLISLISLILFSLAVWTHPLVLIVTGFLWFFYWMQKDDWPFTTKQSIFYTFLLLLILTSKFIFSSNHGYDSGKMESFEHFNFWYAYDVFKFPQGKFIIKNCLTNYWIFSILFIAGMIALVKAKKYLLFAWTFIFTGGYFLLICITYRDVNGLRFYMESEYMPLSIIATAPFVYYLLPKLSAKGVVYILSFIFLVRIGYIVKSTPFFIKRVAITEAIVEKMQEKGYSKVMIPNPGSELTDKLVMNWGTPVETIFLSKLMGDNPQRTAVFITQDRVEDLKTIKPDEFQSCFGAVSQKFLNREYFMIDTTRKYLTVEYKDLTK